MINICIYEVIIICFYLLINTSIFIINAKQFQHKHYIYIFLITKRLYCGINPAR